MILAAELGLVAVLVWCGYPWMRDRLRREPEPPHPDDETERVYK